MNTTATRTKATTPPPAPDFQADKAVADAQQELQQLRILFADVGMRAHQTLAQIEALGKIAVGHMATADFYRDPRSLAQLLIAIWTAAQITADDISDDLEQHLGDLDLSSRDGPGISEVHAAFVASFAKE